MNYSSPTFPRSETTELKNITDKISTNPENYKSIYQDTLNFLRDCADKRSNEYLKLFLESPAVKEGLYSILINRAIGMCNETFITLYQMSKICAKSDSEEYKIFIFSFIPGLITVQLLINHLNDNGDNLNTENIELLLRELFKFQEKEVGKDNLEELLPIYKCFPEFEEKYRDVKPQAAKEVFIDGNFFNGPQTQHILYKLLLEEFLGYLNKYNEKVITSFISLANIFAGGQVSINSFKVMDKNLIPTNDKTLSYHLSVDENLIMSLASGLKKIQILKKDFKEQCQQIFQALASRAASEGLFKAFTFCETFTESEVADIFS
jgi:hypothetical protein